MKPTTYNFLNITKILKSEEILDLDWLENSYQDQEKFWSTLFDYHSSQFPSPGKSSLFENYDLYYDIVIRNLRGAKAAFRWYDQGWQQLNFSDIHLLCLQKSHQWKQQGVEADKTICIVYEMSLELVISVLTALKLGVKFSVLPPVGDAFIKNRLENLSPDFIAIDPLYKELLGDFSECVLRSEITGGEVDYDESSHTYDPEDTVARLFSPLSKNLLMPKELNAEKLFLWGMRDGLLCFHLEPESSLAAPGYHLLQHQPHLFLATMMSGACYTHITLQQVKETPKVLEQEIGSLGINNELRKLITETPKVKLDCQNIFRNPADSLNWQQWLTFIERCKLQKIPIGNVIADAASGGCLLFSVKKPGTVSPEVVVTPATPWYLADINLNGEISPNNFGVLNIVGLEEEELPFASIILSKLPEERHWNYLGNLESRDCGRTYPFEEVISCIKNLPFVEGASVVASQEAFNKFTFTLVVFTGNYWNEEETKSWTQSIKGAVTRHMGAEFVPQQFRYYPLYPRTQEEGIDHIWCKSQFQRGQLHKKSNQKLFQLLTKLRWLALKNGN